MVPLAVAYYVLAFAVYWMYRSFSVSILALVGHWRIQAAGKYDWMGDVQMFPDWDRVHHVILIPTFKEPIHMLKRTLEGLRQQTWPRRRLHVVVSFEAREGEAGQEKAKELKRKFGKTFGDLVLTFHPDISGEVKGKSANIAWAAKTANAKIVKRRKLNVNYVTVTNEDADVVLSPQYFAYLTYQFFLTIFSNPWTLPATCSPLFFSHCIV